MNVVIPAEATLDIYKAAYVVWRKRQLKLCNLVVAYPTRAFNMADKDIVIGVHIEMQKDKSQTFYHGYQDVMAAFNNPIDLKFLDHIPDSVMMCFREDDKSILALKLFQAFDAFEINLKEVMSIHQLLETRKVFHAGRHTVVIGSGENFLSSEERILLFKNKRAQYVIFSSGDAYGIQRCVSQKSPSLRDFAAEYLSSDTRNWFIHRRGHIIVSKSGHTPTISFDELVSLFSMYLNQNAVKEDTEA